MQIVEPYAHMLSPYTTCGDFTPKDGVNALRRIEYFARFSHASEDAQTEDSWHRFLRSVVIERGDWSVVEHSSVTVDAVMDRGCSHEWVRHRLFGFTQSSTRFINHAKKIPPGFIRPIIDDARPLDAGGDDPKGAERSDAWEHAIEQCEDSYLRMINAGAPPQIARSVLPNSLSTRIATTGNLRNWRHFLLMRTTKEAHPQLRQITIPLLGEFKANIPLLFDDIEPGARQIDNMRKPR